MSVFGEDEGSPQLQSFPVDLFSDVPGVTEGVSGRELKERKKERQTEGNGQTGLCH